MTYRSGTHRIARTSIGVSIMITLFQEKEWFTCLTRADPQGEGDSLCVSYCTQKPTDDAWSTPYGSPPTPPGLPSSLRSSWQPYTNSDIVQRSWTFRPFVQEPPNEPVTLKPAIAEVIHPIQYGFFTTTATFTSFGH